jgi:hypothetical protein
MEQEKKRIHTLQKAFACLLWIYTENIESQSTGQNMMIHVGYLQSVRGVALLIAPPRMPFAVFTRMGVRATTTRGIRLGSPRFSS